MKSRNQSRETEDESSLDSDSVISKSVGEKVQFNFQNELPQKWIFTAEKAQLNVLGCVCVMYTNTYHTRNAISDIRCTTAPAKIVFLSAFERISWNDFNSLWTYGTSNGVHTNRNIMCLRLSGLHHFGHCPNAAEKLKNENKKKKRTEMNGCEIRREENRVNGWTRKRKNCARSAFVHFAVYVTQYCSPFAHSLHRENWQWWRPKLSPTAHTWYDRVVPFMCYPYGPHVCLHCVYVPDYQTKMTIKNREKNKKTRSRRCAVNCFAGHWIANGRGSSLQNLF